MIDAIAGNFVWAVALLVVLIVVIIALKMLKSGAGKALVVTIGNRPTYLHVVVTGRNNSANVEHYFEQIAQECRTRNCYRVLIEERLEGPRLAAAEVFELASKGSARYLGVFTAIAFVDVNREGVMMDFAQTVASNRGMPMLLFATVAEAEQWLLTEKPDVAARPESGMAEDSRSQA